MIILCLKNKDFKISNITIRNGMPCLSICSACPDVKRALNVLLGANMWHRWKMPGLYLSCDQNVLSALTVIKGAHLVTQMQIALL